MDASKLNACYAAIYKADAEEVTLRLEDWQSMLSDVAYRDLMKDEKGEFFVLNSLRGQIVVRPNRARKFAKKSADLSATKFFD